MRIKRENKYNLQRVCVLSLFSHVRLFVTPCARQPPLSMGFPGQEYWSGLPCRPLGDLPNPGISPESPASSALQADSLALSHQGSPITGNSYPQIM